MSLISRSKIENKSSQKGEEHIYFNVSLVNPLDSNNDDLNCEFDQSYSQNILDNPTDYKLTVAKLSIPASEIPLFIGQSNVYSCTIEYKTGGVSNYYQEFLSFNSSTVRTYNSLLEALNDAIGTAFTNAKSAHPAVPHTISPWVYYDVVSEDLSIYFQTSYNKQVSLGTDIFKLWFNADLVHLLGVIHYEEFNIPELSNGRCGEVSVPDLGLNRLAVRYPGTASDATSDSFKAPQTQGKFLDICGKLNQFVITSNAFNTRPQGKNSQSLINESNFNNQQAFQEETVLFDLTPDSNGAYLSERFVYTPSLYRWIDIFNSNSLGRIQFKVYYKLGDGELRELKVGIGRVFEILFLFQRK